MKMLMKYGSMFAMCCLLATGCSKEDMPDMSAPETPAPTGTVQLALEVSCDTGAADGGAQVCADALAAAIAAGEVVQSCVVESMPPVCATHPGSGDDMCAFTIWADCGVTSCDASADCDDGNPCTQDLCSTEGMCHYVAASMDGEACEDGDMCTVNDACSAGTCKPGEAKDCSDGVDCSIDSCNSETGECGWEIDNAYCSDGLFCNGEETCSLVDGGCIAGTAPDCTDGDACTDDTCEEGADAHVCVNATVNCDDGLTCTADSCQDGSCVNALEAGNCLIGGACYADGDPEGDCMKCDTATSTTEWTASADGDACQDGNICTVNDFCESGVCQAGELAENDQHPDWESTGCNDSNSCSVDFCDPAGNADAGSCGHSFDGPLQCGADSHCCPPAPDADPVCMSGMDDQCNALP